MNIHYGVLVFLSFFKTSVYAHTNTKPELYLVDENKGNSLISEREIVAHQNIRTEGRRSYLVIY